MLLEHRALAQNGMRTKVDEALANVEHKLAAFKDSTSVTPSTPSTASPTPELKTDLTSSVANTQKILVLGSAFSSMPT